MRRLHQSSPRAKKSSSLLLLSSVLPIAAAVFATASGCGSGHGTSFVNPPTNSLTPSSVLPSAFPSGVLPSGLTPSASPTPTASATASPTPSPTASTAPPVFTTSDVRQTVGSRDFEAGDFNTAGQIIGTRYDYDLRASVGYIYRNGALTRIEGIPRGLNDSGLVVGSSYFGTDHTNAFLLTTGTMQDLGNLGRSSYATAVNRSGQVVGSSTFGSDSSLTTHAFLVENGAMRDLGKLGSGNYSQASDINDAGVVVGSATVSSSVILHPVIYENGQVREIPAIEGGGSRPGEANAINNRGQIVGIATALNGFSRPFLYENGVSRSLGSLGGDEGSAADINDAGQIVGYAKVANHNNHAFLYQNNTMYDLNSYNPDPNGETKALAINENGQILLAVYPVNSGNVSGYLILTPNVSGRKR